MPVIFLATRAMSARIQSLAILLEPWHWYDTDYLYLQRCELPVLSSWFFR